ncbi:DUF2800 domain-containing protein [Corynebacterium pseudotuberculosis]|uniref:DUF2800 domain-containing protein n=1 Tax=Corynebacterium pseudotuberculosis TaxID=1719 RepID=UPI002B4832EC|nr:DUF2800 domain-containing protein [Corynebacterium pseudotuberculosis]MEB3105966.1 DUF2800 domain-containing protein [Corynebacterium pseudotuberculosis]
MPDQHALLSASGAHRWLAYPPSATLEAGLPESSSSAAEQGTAAHEFAEWKLRRALHDAPTAKPVSSWHDAETEALTDDYVAFVQELLRDVRQVCADPQVLIEQRLDFSHVVPGGFGTGDCVIIAEPLLHIIDLKYGQSVMVEAEQNPQLMLYALSALNAFGSLHDIDQVAVTIFQPSRSNISTCTISVTDLEAWAEKVVKPRAEANLVLAKHEFAPPAELGDAEIAQVLYRLPSLSAWATDAEAHALSLAVNQGKTWPGFKLVEGRSIRKYADESAVAEMAGTGGITDIYDYDHKLKTITTLEKQAGKKRFTELLGDLVVEPAGNSRSPPTTTRDPY